MIAFTPLQLRVLDALGLQPLRLRGEAEPAPAGADAAGTGLHGPPGVLSFVDAGAAPDPGDRLLLAILSSIGRAPRALRRDGRALALDVGAADEVLAVDLAELRRSPAAKAALWRRIRPLAGGPRD